MQWLFIVELVLSSLLACVFACLRTCVLACLCACLLAGANVIDGVNVIDGADVIFSKSEKKYRFEFLDSFPASMPNFVKFGNIQPNPY